ncbi:MAG: Sb-PDE family phosphodiesterase [Gammaproteobacteria bacterium]
MKKSILTLAILSLPFQLLTHGTVSSSAKNESSERYIDFPNPKGYEIIVSDLHTHSVFSDGHVWPTIRIEEAVKDGLDLISLTEHLEFQPHRHDIPHLDRNRPYQEGKTAASKHDLIVINGAEITREMNEEYDSPGHINAVFIKDANKLYKFDENKIEEASDLVKWGKDLEGKVIEFYAVTNLWPAENALKEANNQGAFLFWNHPSWTAQRSDGIAKLDPIHEKLIKNKMLHGIEVINGGFYSEEAFQIALDNNLTVMGTSDVHNLIDWDYKPHLGGHRPVTLILSKARTKESIKSALFNRRTVVWYEDLLIGEKENVALLVKACLEIDSASYIYDSAVLRVTIKNSSDTKFSLKNLTNYTIANDDDYFEVPPQGKVVLEINTLERLSKVDLDLEVINAITEPKKNLNLQLSKRIK